MGLPGVAVGYGAAAERRDGFAPRRFGGLPELIGRGRIGAERVLGDLQDEIVPGAVVHVDTRLQAARLGLARIGRAGPAHVERSAAGEPDPVPAAEPGEPVAAVPGSRVENDLHPGRSVHSLDPAQQNGRGGVGGHGQRFTALDDLRARHPAVAPDQRAAFVRATPDEAVLHGRHGVQSRPAEERGEDRVRVPRGSAHPRMLSARTDENAALAVSQQRVVAQHVKRKPFGPHHAPPRTFGSGSTSVSVPILSTSSACTSEVAARSVSARFLSHIG